MCARTTFEEGRDDCDLSLSVMTLNKEGPERRLCGFKYVRVALNTFFFFFFFRTTDSLSIESENSRDDKRNNLVTE